MPPETIFSAGTKGSTKCIKERCAWWNEKIGECAVSVLSRFKRECITTNYTKAEIGKTVSFSKGGLMKNKKMALIVVGGLVLLLLGGLCG